MGKENYYNFEAKISSHKFRLLFSIYAIISIYFFTLSEVQVFSETLS